MTKCKTTFLIIAKIRKKIVRTLPTKIISVFVLTTLPTKVAQKTRNLFFWLTALLEKKLQNIADQNKSNNIADKHKN